MINFDNSATSFPKPRSVARAVESAFTRFGGNPGRGGHALSLAAANEVYRVREQAAKMFGAEPENTVFTSNCTMSLNMALKGMLQYGGHVIISDLEHNAVLRPVYAMSKTRGVSFSIAHISDDVSETVDSFRRLIRHDTRCICCTAASNVTGRITPLADLASFCLSYGICLIVDAAQAAGVLPLSVGDGINFICTAGHKSLYGPSGTGLLVSDGEYSLTTLIEGGTGTNSASPEQGSEMPERLESGTLNTPGILGLGAGIGYVGSMTPEKILSHELRLCSRLKSALSEMRGVKLYTCEHKVGVLSFNISDKPSQEVSMKLSAKGFALRGGLHCSGLAHRSIGTLDQGTVRFSPGAFNTERQTDALIAAIGSIAYNDR